MKVENGWGWVRGFGYANGTPERSTLEEPDYEALYNDACDRLARIERALVATPTYAGAIAAALDIIYAEQV